MKKSSLVILAIAGLSAVGIRYLRSSPQTASPGTASAPPSASPVSPADPAQEPAVAPVAQAAPQPWWSPEPDDGVYEPGRVMVALQEGADLAELAAAQGTWVLRRPGPSGYGILAVPDGQSTATFVQSLLADPKVRDAARIGQIWGAQVSSRSATASIPSWARSAGFSPKPGHDFAGTVVAVLDTGAAWEDLRISSAERYRQSPSLKSVPIYSPYDFVHDDEHPNDDHQHGTHVASLLAGPDGLVPGATLMPLKVLDERERGSELDLVDALWWATDHHADVVNMSLALSPWYVPSRALTDAITHATEHGVVLVAAAGNKASTFTTWPAADPRVIAVGAAELAPDGTWTLAEYSNASPRVDLVAPGGNIDTDFDGDDQPDALLAASFSLQDPEQLGPVWMAGTSQATAVVTAAVVRLLEEGALPDEIRPALQASARPDGLLRDVDLPFFDGVGTGLLDVDAAIDLVRSGRALAAPRYQVRVIPFLHARDWGHGGSQVAVPAAQVTVTDALGNAVDGALVLGLIQAEMNQPATCTTVAGSCVLSGLPEPITDETGAILPLAWGFAIDGVLKGSVVARPSAAPSSGPCRAALLSALQARPGAGSLGYWWSEQRHPTFGLLAEAGVVVDEARGSGTRPYSALFTPTLLEEGDEESRTLRIVGSQDCATTQVEVLETTLSGEGLESAPFTFASLDPVAPGEGDATLTQPDALLLGGSQLFPASTLPLTWAPGGRPTASSLVGSRVLSLSEGEFRTRVQGTGAVEPD